MKVQSFTINLVVVMIFSFLGGIFSNTFLVPRTVNADTLMRYKAGTYNVVGENRVLKGSLYENTNTGAMLNLNDANGDTRLQMGSYHAGGEAGLPLFLLNDNSNRLRFLIRLAGNNESPVLIFKDGNHRDRLVIGLGLNDPDEEPFIAAFDKNGKSHFLLGSY